MEIANLPIIDEASTITSTILEQLKKYGLCYVKISSEVIQALDNVSQMGKVFFRQSEDHKQESSVNEEREGYLNHLDKGIDNIQRYIYKGTRPPKPLASCEQELAAVRAYFVHNIATALLDKIFVSMSLHEAYSEMMIGGSHTLSLIYYPSERVAKERLRPPKDTAMMTVLYAPQPGVTVRLDNEWQAVAVKPGSV